MGENVSAIEANYLVEAVTEAFGERCPDFDAECHCCRAWAQYDALTTALVDVPAVESVEIYFARQIEWSRKTFGPALRTKGIIDHIRKELREIEQEPHDLSEWIDVVILAMDGFWRHGGTAEDLMPALLAKQRKNTARVWPDWRTMSEHTAIEHDRSHDASPPLSHRGEDSAVVIPADLVERCAEILEWKKTGKLPGTTLRELGQSIADQLGNSLFIDGGLGQAEIATVNEALQLVVALAATRSASATDPKGISDE